VVLIPKEFALLLTASFFSLMLAMEGRKKFMSWSRVVLMMVVYVIVNGKTAKVGYHRMVNGKKLQWIMSNV